VSYFITSVAPRTIFKPAEPLVNPFANGTRRRSNDQGSFWRWQAFKLIYILGVIFVLPAIVIGGFALYLAVYEPEELVKRLRSQPQVAHDSLESPSYFVHEEALRKLTKGPADRSRRDVVEKIRPLLRDTNPQNQELAIAAIGKWGNAEDVPILLDLAKDRFSTFIRPQICVALGDIEGDEALEALVEVLGMGSAEWDHAMSALSRRGPAAEEALLRGAQGGDFAKQAAICKALGLLGSEASRSYLESASTSEDSTLAATAQQAQKVLEK
jgi:hypothetical protein